MSELKDASLEVEEALDQYDRVRSIVSVPERESASLLSLLTACRGLADVLKKWEV